MKRLDEPEEMKNWMKKNKCKTEQEALEKYSNYLKMRYDNPQPKPGKEYFNPMPGQKKNKTFRQGQKKYEKRGLIFDPNLKKGKGCFKKWKYRGEVVSGEKKDDKESGEEDYWDENYEPDNIEPNYF